MARARKGLTYDKAGKRYKFKYKGRQYYAGHAETKGDDLAYQNALVRKQELIRDIDRKASKVVTSTKLEYYRVLGKWWIIRRAYWDQRNDGAGLGVAPAEKAEQCKIVICELIRLIRLHSDGVLPCVDKFDFNPAMYDGVEGFDRMPTEYKAVWQGRFDDAAPPKLANNAVGTLIAAFLAEKREEISITGYDALRCRVETFRQYIGKNTDVNAITTDHLLAYRRHLLTTVRTRTTGRDKLGAVKQFLNWCYSAEKLDSLPRVLVVRNGLQISTRPKAVPTFTDNEIKAILAEAKGRTRLYVLLMLNCGFTQVDIGLLRPDEIDWAERRIIHKRVKTKDHDDVPTVEYQLWPETFELLAKYRSSNKDHALLNEDGKPLWVVGIKADNGKLTKNDNVKNAMWRMLRKVKIDKPLKLIRKTSASKLENHSEFGRYAVYFLGQSPRTVSARHYIKPSRTQFDRALNWLGQEYGLIAKDDEAPTTAVAVSA